MIKFTPGELVFTESIELDEILAQKVEKMSSKKINEIVQKVIKVIGDKNDSIEVVIADGTVTCTIDPSKFSTETVKANADNDGKLCVSSFDDGMIELAARRVVYNVVKDIKAAKVKGFAPQLTFNQVVAKVKLHKKLLEECNDKVKDIWGDCLDEFHVVVALNKKFISDEQFKEAMDSIIEEDGKTGDSESAAQPS